MPNAFDDARAAVVQAKFQIEAVDAVAFNMADLLQGRLRSVNGRHNNRHCGSTVLATLKRELQDFDARTGQWKKTK
ncbi:MAG: hypothetical protein V4614_15170 [Pseudomonadota bacterium]